MPAKLKLVLLGPPASGKGTQAQLLSEALGIPALSTGVLIRAEIERGTDLGKKARAFLDEGQLLPDEETLDIIASWLADSGADGFILDGFPRTVPQAGAFDAMLSEANTSLDAALYLEVPRDVLEARILGRLQCPECGRVFQESDPEAPNEGSACPACHAKVRRRNDDNPETFALRFTEYLDKTAPLVPYYEERGLLKTIDGQGSPARVMGEVSAALDLPSA